MTGLATVQTMTRGRNTHCRHATVGLSLIVALIAGCDSNSDGNAGERGNDTAGPPKATAGAAALGEPVTSLEQAVLKVQSATGACKDAEPEELSRLSGTLRTVFSSDASRGVREDWLKLVA